MDQPQTEPQTKKFILVVEDDSFYTNLYKLKLTKEGFNVTIAGNGELALAIARKQKPDLILLDLVMPIKDGFETLKELRADPNLKNVKVIVLSNLSQEEDMKKAKDLGVLDYVVKSNISITEMVEKIKHFLG